MTTPAINRNSVTFRPGYKTTTQWNASGSFPPVTNSDRNVNCVWSKELRPASGSSPFTGKFGWRPCRPWSHSGHQWEYPTNTVNYSRSSGSYGYDVVYKDGSFWGVSPPAVPSFPSGIINQAEVKALNKLKQQDFNLGQFLAEFGETERMIASSIQSIARSIRTFRSANPVSVWRAIKRYEREGTGRRYVKFIPSAWLELQYGWNPLLSDISGAIHHLSSGPRDPFIHCKGFVKEETTLTVPFGAVVGSSAGQLQYPVTHECWVSLYYRLNAPGLAEVSSLGLLNPFELAWECLPYSFVVDWVLPIGPWMSALTADAGFTFQGGSRSLKSTVGGSSLYSVSFERNWGSSFPKTKASGGVPSIHGNAYNFQRSCYDQSPVPGLYVKSPLSALHVVNAIALLMQAFR